MATVQEGERGGRFYISKNGEKVYLAAGESPPDDEKVHEEPKGGKNREPKSEDLGPKGAAERHPPVSGLKDKPIQSKAKELLGRELSGDDVHNMLGLDDAFPGYQVESQILTTKTGDLVVRAEVKDPSSRALVAEVQRNFYKDESGKTSVHHHHFNVEDEYKGQGVGRTVLGNQLAAYEKLGVSSVTTDATRDGMYVWPRMGFDVRDDEGVSAKSTTDELKKEFGSYLVKRAGVSPEKAKELVSKVKNVHGLAVAKVNGADGERTVGKEFLIGRGEGKWGGSSLIPLKMKIEPSSESYKKTKDYLSKGGKKSLGAPSATSVSDRGGGGGGSKEPSEELKSLFSF